MFFIKPGEIDAWLGRQGGQLGDENCFLFVNQLVVESL
jgi:hypothetical protein